MKRSDSDALTWLFVAWWIVCAAASLAGAIAGYYVAWHFISKL